MALLTLPSTPYKGESQNYTLNVTDLIALVTEAYFQDQLNWSKVVVLYQSAVSNQLELINFIPDGVSTSITSSAEFSIFARNTFDVHSITIFDKQNGRYILKASQIPNVINYMIFFPSASNSALNFNPGDNEGYADPISLFMDSNDKIYTMPGYYGARLGGKFFGTVLLDGNNLMATESSYLDEATMTRICMKSDLTFAYVVGQFNGTFAGKTIASPASPYDNQLVEVDMSNGDVRLITPSISGVFYGGDCLTLIEKDGKLLVQTQQSIFLLDTANGNVIWSKLIYGADGCKLAGNSFYAQSNSYDGTNFSFAQIIKVDFLTGQLDNTFPATPAAIATGDNNTFDVGSDGKVVTITANTGTYSVYFYNGSSWSSFGPTGGGTGYCSIDVAASKIYVSANFFPNGASFITQFDYSGVGAVIINNIGSSPFYHVQEFIARDNKITFIVLNPGSYDLTSPNVRRYNVTGTSATQDAAFAPIYGSAFNVRNIFISLPNDKFLMSMSGSPGFSGYNVNPTYAPMAKYFSKYDVATSTFEDAAANVYDNNSTAANIRQLQESPLLPNKIIAVEFYVIKECDTSVTPLSMSQNGWPYTPAASGYSYFTDCLISGDYLYVAGINYNGSTFRLIDTNGAFDAKCFARINLTTKLIDRTFNPAASPTITSATNCLISESNDYIYMSYATSPTAGANNFIRVKKSDDSIELLTGSSAFTWPLLTKAASAANGKLIIFPVYAGNIASYNSFSGKPYALFDEATLTLEASQPSNIASNGGVVTMAKNPVDNLLYAVVVSAGSGYMNMGDYRLTKYDPVALTEQQVSYAPTAPEAKLSPTSLQPVTASFVFSQAGEAYTIIFGKINDKRVYGVRKINPNLSFS